MAPSSTTSSAGNVSSAPGSPSSFSISTMSPTATLYCLPPVLTIAYIGRNSPATRLLRKTFGRRGDRVGSHRARARVGPPTRRADHQDTCRPGWRSNRGQPSCRTETGGPAGRDAARRGCRRGGVAGAGTDGSSSSVVAAPDSSAAPPAVTGSSGSSSEDDPAPSAAETPLVQPVVAASE